MPSLPSTAHRLRWPIVVGILLTSLSMRGPIVAPPPVMGDIRADLALSTAASGLLTGLPVLCFALATPLATWVIRRAGPETAVLVCLLGVLLGTVVRSIGPASVVLTGTLIIGVAITVGNIVVPVVIRRDVPARQVGAVTGAYSAALNVGSMITSIGTAPLAALVGWRLALASWGLLAVVAVVFWARATRGAGHAYWGGQAPAPPLVAPSRAVNVIGWLLMVAFCGQAFAYYAVTTWLPTLLAEERGLDPTASGAVASLFQVAAVVGAFAVPAVAARTSAWVPVVGVGLLWCALPVGLLVAPGAYPTWSVVGGVAQGGGFTALFSIVARVARSDREAATTSARVQTGGYLAATAGPLLAGALHASTGGWDAPLLVVLAATLLFTVAGVLAAVRAGRTTAPPPGAGPRRADERAGVEGRR
jgi:MFS transporter, CP family, cyanate transporter